jgi:hypothetical protein
MTRRRIPPWIVLTIVGSVVVVVAGVLGPVLLFFAFPGPEDANALRGSWQSDYYDGRMEIALQGDGTFREELSGFAALSEQTFEGKWSYSRNELVLSPVLGVSPNGSTEGTLLWKEYRGELRLRVYATVLRGTRPDLDDPPLDFRQVK